ncbi:MAG: hypothetical protein AAF449_18530 [Myxococcota bacterium]
MGSIKLIAALAAVGLGCAPQEHVAFERVSILVDARDPFSARPPGPLMVALLFTTTSTVYGASSVVLNDDQNTVELPLDFPPAVPEPLSFSQFRLTNETILVHVPRIAIFQDDDNSGGFTPWFTLEEPADRIVAVGASGTGVVASAVDFEDAFSRLNAADVNTYYENTGGFHTPFIRFSGATSTLTPAQLATFGLPITSVYFDDSEVPARDVRCFRQENFQAQPELPPIDVIDTSSRTLSVQVDDRLDLNTLCGFEIAACTAVDVDTATIALSEDCRSAGRRLLTRCRRSAAFESIVVSEARLTCDGCSCGWVDRQQAFIVDTSSVPADWPCGSRVPYCTSSLPLYRIDDSCVDVE